jgi:hypothetical protein
MNKGLRLWMSCVHMPKNETIFVSMNHPSILEHIQSGFEGQNQRKVI